MSNAHYKNLIARKIIHIRKVSGLSQLQASKLINVSPQQFQKYESGKDNISAAKFFELCSKLGVKNIEIQDLESKEENQILEMISELSLSPETTQLVVKTLRVFVDYKKHS